MGFSFLAYLALGKLVIWTVQNTGFLKRIKLELFQELLQCGFCVGVWVYITLAFIFRDLNVEFAPDVLVLDQILTGIFASFVIQLISLGWKEWFGTTYAS